jgi:hypothetical protein
MEFTLKFKVGRFSPYVAPAGAEHLRTVTVFSHADAAPSNYGTGWPTLQRLSRAISL